jgi:hypothetical protein
VSAKITIDGHDYPLPDDTDVEELRRRVAQAIFRCEVEQVHLADGRTMLVNWRSVRTVFVDGRPVDNLPPTGSRHDQFGR